MIVRIVRMEFLPEYVASFHQLFDQIKHQIRSFPGCHGLELHADPQNPNVRYTYSIWDSEESLQNYRKSELFGRVWPKTKTLFGAKPIAYSLSLLESISPNQNS